MVEISGDETLQIALCLDAGVNTCAVSITFGDVFDGWLDVTIQSHYIVSVGKMIIVDFGIPVVFIQHIAVILAAYILVRDSQLYSSATLANDGQHAVIVEQTWEQVRVNQVFSRETFSQLRPDVTLVDDSFSTLLRSPCSLSRKMIFFILA